MLQSISAIIALNLLVACGSGGERHNSDDPSKTGSSNRDYPLGTRIHSALGWTGQVRIYLSDSAPERIGDALKLSMAVWNQAIVRDLLSFEGRSDKKRDGSLYGSLDDGQTLVYYEEKWLKTTGKSTATLATTIWENDPGREQAIINGDVIMNAEFYDFQDAKSYDPLKGFEANLADTQTVLLHEIGHLLGLEHVDPAIDPDSVMHPKTYIGPGIYQRSLSDGDVATIRSIYSAQ